jgi:hypothetical protein
MLLGPREVFRGEVCDGVGLALLLLLLSGILAIRDLQEGILPKAFDVLLVVDSSRIARDIPDAIRVMQTLKFLGVGSSTSPKGSTPTRSKRMPSSPSTA